MTDHTRAYDYDRLVREEKEHYAHIEITDGLKEGGAHASSAWQHYWEHVGRRIAEGPFANLGEALVRGRPAEGRPLEILSLGSGYCGHELDLARSLRVPYRIRCTDLNEALFEQARAKATAEGLHVEFGAADINFMSIDRRRYDLILAHACIHHVINLEHLLDQVAGGLAEGGLFHTVDVVGRNRKLIWDENERYANAVLDLVPARITGGRRLRVEEDAEGMEGIRQEEILPQLRRTLRPVYEHRHGAFMRFVCTDPELSLGFDPRDDEARRFLDFLIAADDLAVRFGVLQPLELWGVYRRAPGAP